MADLTTVAQIYDNSGNEITAARVGANNFKLLGDGASGINDLLDLKAKRVDGRKLDLGAKMLLETDFEFLSVEIAGKIQQVDFHRHCRFLHILVL